MKSNTKISQKEKVYQAIGCLGVWVLAVATLLSASDAGRQEKAVVNMSPAYAYINPTSDLWNRNDSKNETVHLTAEYDMGIRIAPISGRK